MPAGSAQGSAEVSLSTCVHPSSYPLLFASFKKAQPFITSLLNVPVFISSTADIERHAGGLAS